MPADNYDPEQLKQTFNWLETNVLNHPEYGKEVKKILKKVDARVNFPELDIEERVEQATAQQKKELEDFKASIKDKENKAYWAGERKKAVDAGYVTEEERPDFEKWMIEENMGNYQRAAKMWREEHDASAAPTNYHDVTGISLPNNPGLFENPIKFARDEAFKFINEQKRDRR